LPVTSYGCTDAMKMLGISGSLREGSYNTLLLAVASDLVAQPVELEIFDLEGIQFYNKDDCRIRSGLQAGGKVFGSQPCWPIYPL
jgi:multimeric flavodoxin WrbA